ncbi:sodium/glutamate symporter [Tissierella sp. Yu-01]|uniref:sodium/glutamate symporter n=1 Tax=Tissierella sp. Yu-01 TaxID=3035694 RepID=UPI00240E8D5F|nr:sodium/glutamate symporter [Tissierella sp. Yu-01]WFA08403.1 sodium/glutamate symporter [Tissierella sp. Yu-01]
MTITMNMIQSIGLAVILLLIGKKLRAKINFFEKYCIPSPVIGGILFAIITLILRLTGVLMFEFDTTLQTFFMTMFFTSVGFNASFKVLKKGGPKVIIFLGVATLLVVLQNAVAVGLAGVVGVHPLLALMTGSTPMTGGHGTSAAFAPTVEALGITGATTVAVAAATFGLVSGSMMGGPVANRLIIKHDLLNKKRASGSNIDEELVESGDSLLDGDKVAMAFFQILIAMGVGVYVSNLIALTGLTMPGYIGSMLVAAVIRNVSDSGAFKTPDEEIGVVGDVALNLFLAMALMTLKLWELIDLAIPMIILLVAQTVLMYLFATYITFPIMGKDYDAAVISAGHCGFGMGATPNGVANMASVAEKYEYSSVAYFVVSLVGALFIDFTNAFTITAFMNLFG